jgi:serine/threonine-protein kinase
VTDAPEPLPAQFGPYWLYDLIGKGGMAEIFLSKTLTGLGTERLCVIKRILPHLSADTSFCEMLIKEAKLCARLSHANVVQTYELGQIAGQYYIAMEYVEGVDLNRLLGLLSRLGKALPLQFALYIVAEALRGLGYAHKLADASGKTLGIIHRDVSPTNVLISTEGEVKMCDFGIAKVAFGDFANEQRLDSYHLKGKFAYMAPEHVAGQIGRAHV